jgi:hypothetical protein
MPMVTSEGFGKGILDQCYDPLHWWNKIATSTVESIFRHGFPIFDTQVSGPDGKFAPIEVMQGMEAVTTDINPRSELVTSAFAQIKELNTRGVPEAAAYVEASLKWISASSGVPEEIFGLGQGKTGLLAQSKWAIFYDKIASMQYMLEPQIDDQVVDDIVVEEGGAPGDAHFVFTNPNPQNQSAKAEYLAKVFGINPLDPPIDNDYIRKELGIKSPKAPVMTQPGGEDVGITG